MKTRTYDEVEGDKEGWLRARKIESGRRRREYLRARDSLWPGGEDENLVKR